MNIWAIADLHLDFARPLDREQYAGRWREHADKIDREWRAAVSRDDIVLIPGDISMARKHRDLQPDFAWLDRLPGLKVLSPGNHDRWWNSVEKIRPMLRRSLRAVDGDALRVEGLVICGVKGAPIARDDDPPALIKERTVQLARLDLALAAAADLRQPDDRLVVLWHFPPFNQNRQPGECVAHFESARVTQVVYGHLHNQSQWAAATQGTQDGIHYACVPADAIGFRPLKLGAISR